MPNRRKMSVTFPLGGLDRSRSYRQQKPYTSRDMLNVRPVGTIDKRNRGGSRPGLVNSHPLDLGGSIRMLAPMTFNPDDDFTYFSDTFDGSSMSGSWSIPGWVTALPSISPRGMASSTLADGNVAGVIGQLLINTSVEYQVEMWIIPYNGAFHGKYRLFLRLNNTTPAYTTDGVLVELVATGSTGAYTGSLKSYLAGVETVVATTSGTKSGVYPALFSARVNGTTVTVYWDGVAILTGTVGAQTGVRAGFGLQCTVSGGLTTVSAFKLQHWFSDASTSAVRTVLVAASDGDIWKENFIGDLAEEIAGNIDIRSDVQISAAQSGTKLYIADYGNLRASGSDGVVSGATLDSATYTNWTTLGISTYNDVVVISAPTGSTVAGTYKIQSVAAGAITLTSSPGNGTCTFRIERAPKVYDPVAETLSIMTATDGQVPTGCPLICRAMGRIFLAGADIAPQVWYASRQEDELDWDYAQTDNQRAVAGTSSPVGIPGSPLTALLAHSDDYVIMGCKDSIWRLQGDPAYGGSISALSRSIGIIDQKSWCFGPDGELVFLSLDGLYMLAPGGNSYPSSISRELLPLELSNIDVSNTEVLMEYDVTHRGVHIFLTPTTAGSTTHFWMDWPTKTFWPVSVNSDFEPTAICQLNGPTYRDSNVILGCRDGRLRRFSDAAENDLGTAFTNYVDVGPLPLAAEGEIGVLVSADAVIGTGSGSVSWTVKPALTAEAVSAASTSASGTWSEGLNATNRRLARGQAYLLRISGASGRRWELESIETIVENAGKRRVS